MINRNAPLVPPYTNLQSTTVEEIIPSHYFRAFCHLREERSFLFEGDIHALLCHRCSGIYTFFFIALILSLIFRWDGKWSKNQSIKMAGISAATLLFLSLVHVGIKKIFGPTFLEGGWQRYIIGSCSGLGLLQIYCLLKNPLPQPRFPPLFFALLLLIIGLSHSYGLSHSFEYHALTSLLGLASLYICMNDLVLSSYVQRGLSFRIPLLVLLVSTEWTLLYLYNTRNG